MMEAFGLLMTHFLSETKKNESTSTYADYDIGYSSFHLFP